MQIFISMINLEIHFHGLIKIESKLTQYEFSIKISKNVE